MERRTNGTYKYCVAPDKKGLGKVRFRIVCLGCPEIMIFMPYMTLHTIKSNGTSHQMVHVAPL